MIAALALLVVMLCLALAWKLHAAYLLDKQTARAQTKSFVQAMDAHVTNAIQVVDLALMNSADGLKSLAPEKLQSPETVRRLLASSGMSDKGFWLIFLDADGKGVVASNGLAIGGVSYADRPYFTAHVERDSGLFVGSPQVGKVSRRRLFFLSRAVRSPEGRFLGVVAAPVDAGALATVFQSSLFQPDLSITLAHTDGRLITRAPKFEESFATDLRNTQLFAQLSKSPSGTYEAKSIVDGDDRVYSYRSLSGLPLVVSVGLASQSWTTGLIDDFIVGMAGLATILAILLVGGRFALTSYRRLDTSEGEHRLLNAELEAARALLAESEKRMRMVADSLPALVSYVDADERYVFCNAAYAGVRSLHAETIVGKTVREVLGDAEYALVSGEIALAMAGQHVVFEREVTSRNAVRQWKFEYTPDVVGGSVHGLYAFATDITDTKRIEHRLRSLARIDALTGLPNRQHLFERLREAIGRSRRTSKKLACFYLDIDGFKQVNDTLGHGWGDDLLCQFGARLQACVRQTDLVARIAGDEFVVVAEGLDSGTDAEVIASKIIDAMRIPFLSAGTARLVTTSIGIALSTDGDDDEDPDSLLRKADSRLYLAKRMGKNLFRIEDA